MGVSPSSSTLTIAKRLGFPGLTASLPLLRSTSPRRARLSSPPTCLTFRKSPLRRTLASARTTLRSSLKLESSLSSSLVSLVEEDGVDNTDVDSSRLYTQPEEVWYAYEQLSQVPNGMFTCAASFGNVHGVYAPGNVDLQPVILHNSQKYISEKLGGKEKKPML